ncbi:TatD family hydrolase [bacterium]|nr:TatD family hydrolase [bacterium]MBT5014861.1 TatD family hydrolase [bacterium]
MLIDSHCHINLMVKKKFDILLTKKEIELAQPIIDQAKKHNVDIIVNVGTSLPESKNCISLAQAYPTLYATAGIHPNDCSEDWKNDFTEITKLVKEKEHNKIVAIGEIGIDLHYPDSNLSRQTDAFKAQIELALENDLCIVIHSRDAYDETLSILEPYQKDIKRGIFHCFSYDQPFARQAVEWGFALGIDGPVTYPKNDILRAVVRETPFSSLVLETDSPYLPPQIIRGKPNSPQYIATIASFIADLKKVSLEEVSEQTTQTVRRLFNI